MKCCFEGYDCGTVRWMCSVGGSALYWHLSVREALSRHQVRLVIPVNYCSLSITICIHRSYVATGFQTYKWINNLFNCQYISVAVYSCKRCDRKRKWSFEVSDSRLVGYVIVPDAKSDILRGNIARNFKREQWKNNGYLFTKILKFCSLLSKIN